MHIASYCIPMLQSEKINDCQLCSSHPTDADEESKKSRQSKYFGLNFSDTQAAIRFIEATLLMTDNSLSLSNSSYSFAPNQILVIFLKNLDNSLLTEPVNICFIRRLFSLPQIRFVSSIENIGSRPTFPYTLFQTSPPAPAWISIELPVLGIKGEVSSYQLLEKLLPSLKSEGEKKKERCGDIEKRHEDDELIKMEGELKRSKERRGRLGLDGDEDEEEKRKEADRMFLDRSNILTVYSCCGPLARKAFRILVGLIVAQLSEEGKEEKEEEEDFQEYENGITVPITKYVAACKKGYVGTNPNIVKGHLKSFIDNQIVSIDMISITATSEQATSDCASSSTSLFSSSQSTSVNAIPATPSINKAAKKKGRHPLSSSQEEILESEVVEVVRIILHNKHEAVIVKDALDDLEQQFSASSKK
ncbi:uncharacterized protein MONOS_2748 [Monocercomonoides exilis]|uniref:uncharacterized protein n=1 Tax=Monocercomonoides exilis TaxID=2049356 RepID=UPI00355AC32F|nr:hypothetical protein MONOS_2748 [Monocercomonoides exilis]|eukprot:MONOS_2748.1-p1 / transcript=MONOS_2748.1 / gene=MONOS_2748 / organism=Monocercomonoides_exilis_PA203 / gene_product=unspecified product / transcript_product=unspecified product / location=Mono_scaffold00058:111127-112438(-) / protein_length=417 / sequence_SO=supercontig / SO=protein_coding / is_pseudo=false